MLDSNVRAFAAEGRNFGSLTTLLPDGRPMTQLVWVDADEEHVLVNTEVGRQKYANVVRDPRVAIAIADSSNPYRYAEVRGRVTGTVSGEAARRHIDRLSERYTGGPYSRPIETERVILQITPERVRLNG